jgi:stage V sporulation protein R
VDDILLFLLENAPLERWQQEILAMVRAEAYYFAPQGQTKIMNEGWATFWHSRIMTSRVIDDSELVDYADHHSGTVAMGPGRLNPYKIGLELFRDIEDRWNRGAHGPNYEDCQDLTARRNWDEKHGSGLEKIFEVRRLYNDVNFLDTYLTEDFCARQRLFTFRYNPRSQDYEVASRDFREIKRRLLFALTRMGNPWIQVVDANADNRAELLLEHRHEGVDLDLPYLEATLGNLARIWSRPVQLLTAMDEKPLRYRHDGQQLEKTERER